MLETRVEIQEIVLQKSFATCYTINSLYDEMDEIAVRIKRMLNDSRGN